MLVFVKFGWMRNGDTFVLSKGHAAAALYSLLAEAGSLSENEIATFYKNGTHLSAHPPINKISGIPFATGSLGHGLSLCAGMALGARFKNEQRDFFCITSDGELNEGSVWEAALFIAQMKLHNIVWLIDRNQIQGIGRTEDVMKLEPVEEKLRAFGFFAASADGHDFESLALAKQSCIGQSMPKAIICNTVKGHGIASWENTVDCHYLPMTSEQYEQALVALEHEHKKARP
jgi:transketolase